MATSKDSILTAERARELLRYEPETGKLYWRVNMGRWGHIPVGTEAGYVSADRRYRRVRIDGRLYLMHRVIWLAVTGAWPTKEVDHISGDGLDNRWGNLREVSHIGNRCNAKRPRNNKSGVIGVCWSNQYGKWKAYITVNKTRILLGYFDDVAAAAKARKAAERRYGFHENHGRAA